MRDEAAAVGAGSAVCRERVPRSGLWCRTHVRHARRRLAGSARKHSGSASTIATIRAVRFYEHFGFVKVGDKDFWLK